MDDINSIFQDKIKLSAAIVQKEFDMITEYSKLLRRIRSQEITQEDMEKDIDYHIAWQQANILYQFLENKYALDLKKKNKSEYEKLIDIMTRYEDEKEVSYSEFKFIIKRIIKIMSLANFDDVVTKSDADDFDE